MMREAMPAAAPLKLDPLGPTMPLERADAPGAR
jgi:hypothetical protein